MKLDIITFLFSVFLFFSCYETRKYTPEKCGSIEEVSKTENLSISDTLIGFSGFTSEEQRVSLFKLNKEFIFFYFKKNIENQENNGYIFYLNEEIPYKDLGQSISAKNGNIIITDDAKIADAYGVKLKDGYKIQTTTLFIADKNKVIQRIYENACEEDIIRLVDGMVDSNE